MTVGEQLREAGSRVAERAARSTVRIGRGDGRGAGFVVAEGLVVTNAHNLRGRETTVTFSEGQATRGEVKGVDPDGDLAVVAVETSGAVPLPWLPEGEIPGLGEPVWTVTIPAGDGPRVTWGAVSALNRSFRGPGGRLIRGGVEHTAPVARGSSGGPVVDEEGRLVGINTHRLGEGFYLAIPADAELRSRIDALAAGQQPRRVRLGVALAPPQAARRLREAVGLPPRDGILVRAVEDGSPAARAGIARGDLIVEVGGQPVTNPDDLFAALEPAASQPGVTVTVVRGVDEVRLEVVFEAPGGEGGG